VPFPNSTSSPTLWKPWLRLCVFLWRSCLTCKITASQCPWWSVVDGVGCFCRCCRTGHGQSPWAKFGQARASASNAPARGSSRVGDGVASLMRTGTRNRGRNGRKSRTGWLRCFRIFTIKITMSAKADNNNRCFRVFADSAVTLRYLYWILFIAIQLCTFSQLLETNLSVCGIVGLMFHT